MGDYPDSSMIAFLPKSAPWVKQDLPHLTLVYAGEISESDAELKSELIFNAAVIAMLLPKFQLKAKSLEIFGEEDKVDVLTFEPTTNLLKARQLVKEYNASQHKIYKPHVTIGPAQDRSGLVLPHLVEFDRIMVGWGDERYEFELQ